MKNNPVVHLDRCFDGPDKLGKFYADLFDWTFERIPGVEYSGILKRTVGNDGHAWLNFISFESLEETLDRAQESGATVVKEKSKVPGMGWFSILIDPEGNPFAVWQLNSGVARRHKCLSF